MCSETASQLPEENPAQPVRETQHGAMNAIPQGYSDLLQNVKRRVAQARVRDTLPSPEQWETELEQVNEEEQE